MVRFRRVTRSVPRRTTTDESETFVQLLSAEYAAIRAETLQTMQNMHTIVQWTLGAYAVVFGTTYLALGSKAQPDFRSAIENGVLLVYMLMLPGLICAATWQWLGDFIRMARSDAYLRGLEAHLASKTRLHMLGLRSPLNWSTFLSGPRATNVRFEAHLGTGALMTGLVVASLSIGVVVHGAVFGADRWSPAALGWLALGAFSLAAYSVIVLVLTRRLLTLTKMRYHILTGELRSFH